MNKSNTLLNLINEIDNDFKVTGGGTNMRWDQTDRKKVTSNGHEVIYWRTGTVGGLSEEHFWVITTLDLIDNDILHKIAKEIGAQDGSPFGHSDHPKMIQKEGKYVYTWRYSPSTE